jgi:hypothetical protein
MDPLEREFAFLAAAADDRIAELRAMPAVAGDSDRARGRSIAAHLGAVLDGVADAVAYRRERYTSAVSDVQRLSEIRELRVQNRLLNGIDEMRPWLQVDRYGVAVSPGVVAFLDEACAAIVQEPADVICYPTTAYAYSSATTPFRDYLEQLHRPEPAGPIPIVLDYPAQEVETLFFHVLLLHELGHSADRVHDLYGGVTAADSPDVAAALEDAAQEGYEDNPTQTRIRLGRIRELRAVWLLETICDALAFSYCGPAYLLGFAAFLLRYKDDLPTNRHPSTQLRLRLLLEQAGDAGWTDMMRNTMPLIVEWLENVSSRERSPVPHPFGRVEEVLEMSKAEVWRTVDAHLGERRCDPHHHEAEIRRVQRLLPRRILPVEHNGRPLDLRAILAAGWLETEPDSFDPAALVHATEDTRKQGFLAKAMEMSALLKGWLALGLPREGQ